MARPIALYPQIIGCQADAGRACAHRQIRADKPANAGCSVTRELKPQPYGCGALHTEGTAMRKSLDVAVSVNLDVAACLRAIVVFILILI